jgi:hypothetical protein
LRRIARGEPVEGVDWDHVIILDALLSADRDALEARLDNALQAQLYADGNVI